MLPDLLLTPPPSEKAWKKPRLTSEEVDLPTESEEDDKEEANEGAAEGVD